jgi:hypothetical protein
LDRSTDRDLILAAATANPLELDEAGQAAELRREHEEVGQARRQARLPERALTS